MELIKSLFEQLIRAIAKWLGLRTPDEPEDPPDLPEEPEQPEEPDPPVDPPAPVIRVLYPDEFVTSTAFHNKDTYVEAARSGDGKFTDRLVVALPSGRYTMWVRAYSVDGDSDAFYAGIDTFSRRKFQDQWGKWAFVNMNDFEVTQGNHTVGIGPAEPGLKIDVIVLVQEGYQGTVDQLVGAPPVLEEPIPDIEEPEEPIPEARMVGLLPYVAFDPAKPVINGKLLTGKALEAWEGIRYLVENHKARRYSEVGKSIDELAAKDSSYHLGRNKHLADNDLTAVYLLTGWLAPVDELVRLFRIQRQQLKAGYRTNTPGYDPSKVRMPPSPHKAWGWQMTGGDEYVGTTYHVMDSTKTAASVARFTHLLEHLRGVKSPAGYDYADEADQWKAWFLEHFIPMWRGPEVGGIKGWSENYKGAQHTFYSQSRYSKRMGIEGRPDQPIMSRQHIHTHVSASMLTYYLGKIFPQEAAGIEIGIHGIKQLLLANNIFFWDGKYGLNGLSPRSLQGTGHYELTDPVGTHMDYVFPTTYIPYPISEQFIARLEGWLPEFGTGFASPLANVLAEYAIPKRDPNYGLPGDVTANTTVTGYNSRGQKLTLLGAGTYHKGKSFTGPRSKSNIVSQAFGYLIPWDASGKMDQLLQELLGDHNLFSDSRDTDPSAKPRVFAYNIGKLVRAIGLGT